MVARSRARLVPALVAALALCTACATPQPIQTARAELRGGDAEAALATLADADVPGRDRLLLLLDRGMAAQAAGRYRDSIAALNEADALVERLDYVSVREQGVSLLVSDRATDYRGESSERLWIHTFQMINFLALGDPEGAAVEARRAVVELDAHEETFSADPVTRLLVAMSFEAAGQIDSASVEYRKLTGASGETDTAPGVLRSAWLNARRTARPEEAAKLATKLPDDVLDGARDTLARRGGELVVVLADGFLAPKLAGDSGGLLVSNDVSSSVRIAFPYYAAGRGPAAPSLEARVDGATVKTVTASTHLVDVARAALAERGRRIALRQAARVATKYNIAHLAGSRDDPLRQILSGLFLLLEQADTRSWESLPATLTIAQIPLPAGRHDVQLIARGSAREHRVTLEDVAIRDGRRTFRSLRPDTATATRRAPGKPAL